MGAINLLCIKLSIAKLQYWHYILRTNKAGASTVGRAATPLPAQRAKESALLLGREATLNAMNVALTRALCEVGQMNNSNSSTAKKENFSCCLASLLPENWV